MRSFVCPSVTQSSPVSIQTQSLALRALRCVKENRKKCKRLRWQAANHGCHCFDRAFLLTGACVCCVKHATQAIAFEWKPGFSMCLCNNFTVNAIASGQNPCSSSTLVIFGTTVAAKSEQGIGLGCVTQYKPLRLKGQRIAYQLSR